MKDAGLILREREDERVMDTLANSYEGRYLVWRILETARLEGAKAVSFTAGQPDLSAFLDGQKQIALDVENWVFTRWPEQASIMRREADARERSYAGATDFDEEMD